MQLIRGLVLSSVISFLATGCSTSSDGGGDSGGVSPTMAGPAEAGYCSTPGSYSPSVTVTGNAQYIKRQHFFTGSGGLGSASLTDPTHPAAAFPIRYAEVRVLNASGGLVQCGETDGSGNFSLTLPQGSATYTVGVASRSLNSHLHASVLNSPDSNTFYLATNTVTASSNTSGLQITAAADGEILGGAFNILDQLLNANEYLVSKVGTCASTFPLCSNYDPTLHKITAYWKKGFNPNDYFGTGGGGLSFYLPGYSRLFILGGINGDVNSSDTDHFDDSIIVHEYGHFMEDNWFKTDSPGGSHNGDEIIDPRLAWSEGWGDFFQAAVRNDNHYVDSQGNVDGSTQLIYYVDTETVNPGGFDYTSNLGEGNFREFSVTRLLWDAIDSVADTQFTFTDNVSNAFNEIWASLTKTTNGFRDSNFAFRNVSLVHLAQIYLHNNAGAQDWTNIRGLNRHIGDSSRYGQPVISSGVTAPSLTSTSAVSANCSGGATAVPSFNPTGSSNTYFFSVTPSATAGDTGSLSTSNLFANNRFYHLKIGSSPFVAAGFHTLQLQYEDHDHTGTLNDLDLYLYNSDARFGTQSDIITYSRDNPNGNPASVQYEPSASTINATLPSGDYLINVNVYTGSSLGGQTDFNLLLDGVVLCPYDLVH